MLRPTTARSLGVRVLLLGVLANGQPITSWAGSPSEAGESAKDAASSPTFAEVLIGDYAGELLQSVSPRRDEEYDLEKPEVDDRVVEAAGLRKLIGRHITIFTDLPEQTDLSELPLVLDLSVTQWARYFRIPAEQLNDWNLNGFLMKDELRFVSHGLLPPHIPKFKNGYQRGYEFWMREQPSDYYRRHLLLHESAHAFMQTMLGGLGPPWYAEGMAEFLATHRWKNRRLTTRYMPRDRDAVPYWGRVKVIRDEFAAGRALLLNEVMRNAVPAHDDVVRYAWSWAATAFLDGNPMFRSRFRALRGVVAGPPARVTFTFKESVIQQLRELDEQWRLFISEIDYGYDFAKTAIEYGDGQPLPEAGKTVSIDSRRGWQTTKIHMEAGKSYRLACSGRYVIAREEGDWWCEPGGVTIRYHSGLPLGMAIGTIRPDVWTEKQPGMGRPFTLGRGRQFVAPSDGTLYVRVNDSPSELADNEGELSLEVSQIVPPEK